MDRKYLKMSKFKRKNKLTRELAEPQIELLNEFYDVDLDFMTESVRAIVESHLLTLLKYIVRGYISIDEAGDGIKITQFLVDSKIEKSTIEYAVVDGLVLTALERATGSERPFAVAGALSKIDPDTLRNLGFIDRAVTEAIGSYFLYA